MTIRDRGAAVLELMKLENEMRRLLADNKRLIEDKEALLVALRVARNIVDTAISRAKGRSS